MFLFFNLLYDFGFASFTYNKIDSNGKNRRNYNKNKKYSFTHKEDWIKCELYELAILINIGKCFTSIKLYQISNEE